jgi:glycosyltransferase involved in cell wall biosynthesis
MRPRVLFLYTELAAYTIACLHELFKSADIAVVRWPVNKEAPFQFEVNPNWIMLESNQLKTAELIEFSESFNPNILICSGWVDKRYNAVAKYWKGRIPTVLIMDNHFTGSLKQRLGKMMSRSFIHSRYSRSWVPGKPQRKYAQWLGFKPTQISEGFYSADTDQFTQFYEKIIPIKKKSFPHRFIFIGRYVDFKGIQELWEASIAANKESEEPWELWCLGTGDLWEKRVLDQTIRHKGFVQPYELGSYLEQTGVFVLPSHKEPWGVVVHEMAIAGFPLVLSDKIGAASAFLEEGVNGYQFEAGNVNALKTTLLRIMGKSDQELLAMGEESRKLGLKLQPSDWVQTILSLL